jgi:putative ABC transport system permease protein
MSGRVTLAITTVTSSGGNGTTRTVTAPGFALPHRPQAPVTTMTTATARSLGLDPAAAITLATTSRLPTVTEEDRLRAALGSWPRSGPHRGCAGRRR